MGLLTEVLKFINKPPEVIDLLPFSKKQIKDIKAGYAVSVLENKKFQPRVFSIALRGDMGDLKKVTEKDVIIRDITAALVMAGHDLMKVRKVLKKKAGKK